MAGTTLDLDAGKQDELFDVARVAWAEAGRPEPHLAMSFWFAIGDGDEPRAQVHRHLRRYMNWIPAELVDAMAPTTGWAGTEDELLEVLRGFRGHRHRRGSLDSGELEHRSATPSGRGRELVRVAVGHSPEPLLGTDRTVPSVRRAVSVFRSRVPVEARSREVRVVGADRSREAAEWRFPQAPAARSVLAVRFRGAPGRSRRRLAR